MNLDIDDEIDKANARLGKTRVKIFRRGGTLWLRGTFPPKPHLDKSKPYQQKMPLGVNATLAGLKKAEQEAKIISAQLELGTFIWTDWIEIKALDNARTIGYWVEKFTEDYWHKHEKDDKSLRSWYAGYGLSFSKLPLDQDISISLLIDIAKITKPNSRIRQAVCRHFYNLAKFAGLQGADTILEFKGNYSPSEVIPRELPDDATIARVVTSVKDPAWRWWLCTVAAYGIRPKEAFSLEFTKFPQARVQTAKIKNRIIHRTIYPLYPEWATDWGLQEKILPPTTETARCTYGQRLALWVNNHDLPFVSYDLRHCYARRLFEFGIAPDRGAKLMGHSLSTHVRIYRAWIDEEYYRKFFEAEIYREDRPRPPKLD